MQKKYKMQKRYKIVKVGTKRKVVNERFDATIVAKVDSIHSIKYVEDKEKAIQFIEKLIERDNLAYEMDHSWGAPPECFENQASYTYYIVDRDFGTWYNVYYHECETLELQETTPVEKQLKYVM